MRSSLLFAPKGLDLFVCGDQLLRGAALNAVLIAEAKLQEDATFTVMMMVKGTAIEEQGLTTTKSEAIMEEVRELMPGADDKVSLGGAPMGGWTDGG